MEKVFHHRREEHIETQPEKVGAEVKEDQSFFWLP